MSDSKKIYDVFLSIIMPCYNAYEFLDKSVNSLIYQQSDIIKYKKLELIIVDDASDDNKTINKCRELANKHHFIRLLELKNNIGQGYARNEGIKIAQGKYIAFMDADDEVSKSYFNVIEDNLSKNPGYDTYAWGLTELHYDRNNKVIKQVNVVPESKMTKDMPICSLHLEKNTLFGYLWNKLYKTEIIKNNNILFSNKSLLEDYLFNLKFAKNARSICCINKPLYKYKRRLSSDETVTSKFYNDYFEQHYERVETMYDWLSDSEKLDEEAKKILANIYIRYSLSAVWRNKNPLAKMTKQKRNDWLNKYFNLRLSKELIPYANPNGYLARVNAFFFKKHMKKCINLEACLVNIFSKHFDKTLIRARQSR